jgi:transcriptional regulator with XRE-family HTH domain
MKLALSQALRQRRAEHGLTQSEFAKKLKSSQSRVAKMEASDASVSVDLLMRGLLAAGATPKEIARVISTPPTRSAA